VDDDDADDDVVGADNAYDLDDVGERNLATTVVAEVERLVLATCRHRAAAVDGGTCMACGTEVW